jgi:hypothetical protein
MAAGSLPEQEAQGFLLQALMVDHHLVNDYDNHYHLWAS